MSHYRTGKTLTRLEVGILTLIEMFPQIQEGVIVNTQFIDIYIFTIVSHVENHFFGIFSFGLFSHVQNQGC